MACECPAAPYDKARSNGTGVEQHLRDPQRISRVSQTVPGVNNLLVHLRSARSQMQQRSVIPTWIRPINGKRHRHDLRRRTRDGPGHPSEQTGLTPRDAICTCTARSTYTVARRVDARLSLSRGLAPALIPGGSRAP